eukprot:sb/3470512/
MSDEGQIKEKKKFSRSDVFAFLFPFLTAVFSFLIGYYTITRNLKQFKADEANWTYREACLSGRYTNLKDLHRFVSQHIPVVQGELSRDEFLENHLMKERPVLMKGAALHWKSYKLWSDDYLNQQFHDVKFYIDLRKHHSTDFAVRRKMKLTQFLMQYRSKDWYLDSMTMDTAFMDGTNESISRSYPLNCSSFCHICLEPRHDL